MKAAVIHKHGGLEEIVYQDFPDPEMAAGEVLVGIRAVALNHLDIFTLRGMPGIKVPLPMIGGGDMAGEIVKVGATVGGWKPGDRVMAVLGVGAFAEEAVAPVDGVFPIPEGMDYTTAAAFPVAYGTSHLALTERAAMKAGETLLVLGAGGGVGLTAVECGKALGATVIAAASTQEKLDLAKAHGADHLINYVDDDLRAWPIPLLRLGLCRHLRDGLQVIRVVAVHA